MLHLGNIVDAVEHTGGDKPFDGFFKVPRPAALPDSAVDKLFIGFGKLGDDAADTIRMRPLFTFPLCLEKSFS